MDVRLEEPQVDTKSEKYGVDAKSTNHRSRDTYEAVLIFDESDNLSDRRGGNVYRSFTD